MGAFCQFESSPLIGLFEGWIVPIMRTGEKHCRHAARGKEGGRSASIAGVLRHRSRPGFLCEGSKAVGKGPDEEIYRLFRWSGCLSS